MKSRIGKIASSVLLLVFCLVLCLFVGCDKDKDKEPEVVTEYGINGVYYMDDADAEYLFTITGNQFLISGLNGEQKGTFTYESGALTLTFSDAANTTAASASLDGNVLKLVYNGNTYSLYKRVNYTVSFDAAGGSAVADQTVTNGKTATKPADPAKEGYAFIGWYTDAAYTTPFAFDTTVITANTTVYARFEATNGALSEYTVTFISDTAAYDSVTTVGGVVYNLPTPVKEGYTFAGWWVSDYQSVDKPTYRYEGGKLTQNTKLFAVWTADDTPLVSVNATGASWTVSGINSDYRITVKQGDTIVGGYDNRPATGDGTYPINFSALPEGDYTVTVTKGDKSFTAYYKNKALDRVSQFRVVSSSLLVFLPVANAEKYYVTILCGNPLHNHTNVDNGTSTNYNFSNCSMSAEGIRFVVTAVADGYAQSVSDVYTYYLGLDAVSDVTVDNEKVTWDTVENAVGYKVEISVDGGETYESAYVSGTTSYSIASYAPGSLKIKVTAVTDGYYSPAAEAVTFEKTTLATPAGITVDGASLTWNEVDGAVGYSVNVDGTVYTTETNTLPLTQDMLVDGKFTYGVSIMALADDAAANSAYSAVTPVQYATMGTVTYRDGNLFWAPVVGAYGYKVQVNGGSITKVAASAAGTPVTLNRSGINTLSVCFVNENGDDSAWVTIEVKAYKVELDVRGGVAVGNFYKALGDTMVLPETSRDGYDFAGWYTSPNAIANNGKQYTSAIFDGNSDIVLYAGWGAKKYTVTLNAGDGTAPAETVTVVYGEINTIPVATTTDATKMFSGWFSEPNGAGIRYFDEDGKGTFAWNTPSDVTLYAYFSEVLSFDLIENGTAYSVSKGPYGIGKLTKITIPAEYNGLPVTTVEGSAFLSCTTLVEVNIPNTIVNVEVGSDGSYYTGSAFQGCTKLAAVNVYEVEGAKDVRYWSVDGVLYYNSEFNGVQIKCYPYAKAGVLTIPEGVTTIPSKVLRSAKVTEVYVPYTVTSIDANAFYSCTYLTKVAFLDAPEDAPEDKKDLPLSIESKAFYSCSKLASIILPSRMASFKPDVFTSCSALSTIDVSGTGGNYSAKGPDGRKVLCTANGSEIVFCPKGMEGDYTIPTGVTTIGEEAFMSCTKLTSVTIPGYVTEIKTNAFKSCSGMTDLTFGDDGNGLVIRESAFYSCSSLTSLVLPASLYQMEQFAFGSTSKLTTVTVNSAGKLTTVGEGDDAKQVYVVDFAVNAFGTNSSAPSFYVTTLTIGKNVPVFDVTGVFGQKLDTVNVEDGNPNYASVDGVLFDSAITSIVYYPLSRVGEYVLPDTVTTIGARVFQSRTGLTKITIGKNVTSIGEGAFYSCTKLEEIIFEDGGTEALVIGDSAFRNCDALTTIDFPVRTTTIGAYALYDCDNFTSIVVPEGVTTIGDYAFSFSYGLLSVALPSTLESFGSDNPADGFNVFDRCRDLVTITMTDTAEKPSKYFTVIDSVLYKKTEVKTVTGEGDDAVETVTYVITDLLFAPINKSGSTTVTIPGTVARIWKKAFYNNATITEVVFEDLKADSLEFGEQAFGYCKLLAKITLPKGLKTIGKNMFYYCTSLEDIVIPNTVTSIQNQAFYQCSALSSLTFEDGGTEPLVLENATSYSTAPFYGCKSLTSIVFPERLTVIGNYVFADYSSTSTYAPELVSVTLPATVERIGNYAFSYCTTLETVTFTNGTTLKDESADNPGIGKYAFNYCSSLKNITLPESPNTADKYTVGNYAFYRTGVESIHIPVSVKALGEFAFYYATNLSTVTFAEGACPTFGKDIFRSSAVQNIVLPEGMTEIPVDMFEYDTALTSIVIPSTVTSIGKWAFDGCTSLSSITFATYTGEDGKEYSRVGTISAYAFQKTAISSFTFPTLEGDATLTLGEITSTSVTGKLFANCPNLTTVTLSKSVSSIDEVFSGCTTITNFIIDEENENYSAVPGSPILYNKTQTAYRYICGQLSGEHVIPDGVTEISAHVFENQFALTKVVIPTSIKVIGDYAFSNCTSLVEVVFNDSESSPSQLTSFGTYAFNKCGALTTVSLPAALTTIPNYTFYYCSSLTAFTIPAGVTEIGNYAFGYTNLTTITIPASVKSIGTYAFIASNGKGTLTAVVFAKNSENTSALEKIDTSAFRYQALTSVTVPASVTTLSNYVFANNVNLTEIKFETGSQLETLGTYLFYGDTALTSIRIPANVKALGNYDFDGCTALEEVIFEGTAINYLGTYTFRNCTSLKSFTIPENVKVLGTSATAATITSGVYLFKDCTALESVTFAGDATLIGGYVFQGCTALKSITIPQTVTQLGAYAFDGCTSLETINFDENSALNAIGAYCFRGSGLTSIEIPAKVTVLGTSATAGTISSSAYQFVDCANLASVTFKGDMKLLGGYVFQNCTALTSITLPGTVTQIGNYCFDGCTSLASVTFEAGTAALTMGTYAFQNAGLTSIALPDRLTKIPNYAFLGCDQLTSLTLGAKVTEIGNSSFRGCELLTSVTLPATLTKIDVNAFMETGLTSVNIPAKVSTIGNNAFGCCYDLTSFTVDSANTTFAAGTDGLAGMLIRIKDKTIICVPGGYTGALVIPTGYSLGAFALNGTTKITTVALPDGITEIPDKTFIGAAITSFVIPSTVTKIGISAFEGSEITSITIPAGVTSIGSKAFYECYKLKTVVFEADSQLTSLGTYAFAESGIESIVIPKGITLLGTSKTSYTYTFKNCTSLTSVTFEGALEAIGGSTFEGCTALASFEIPATVTYIGYRAFYGAGLESITIPGTVTEFGTYPFTNCTNLKTVTFGEGFTTFATNMFDGCTLLDNVVIPASLTTFGNYAFRNCTSLKNVTFEEGFQLTALGTYAFAGCTALESITLPESVTMLYATQGTSSYTFDGCTSLTSVTFLSDKFDTINGYAFRGCTSLTSFTVPASVTYIGTYAFSASGLESFTIPGTVTYLGSNIFKDCTSLTSVEFGEGLTALSMDIFWNCTALETVKFSSTMATISSYAFETCTGLKALYVPATVTEVMGSAFANWTSEQTIYFECSESDSANWASNWNNKCEANIVWEYKA